MGLTTVFDLLVTFLVTAPLLIIASRSGFWSKPSVNGMGKAFKTAEARRAQAQHGDQQDDVDKQTLQAAATIEEN